MRAISYPRPRAELNLMVQTGRGSIVNMASAAGPKNAPGMAAYTAAKHAVVGLTKNAALQYATRGIRVNAICPGTIGIPAISAAPAALQQEWAALIQMGRIGTPQEVAQAIGFLLSDHASFITDAALLVDGGYMYS
jgi:NAD(P)-dependent dehydrogenase (short-subunit alcohol dehydrogenase family)